MCVHALALRRYRAIHCRVCATLGTYIFFKVGLCICGADREVRTNAIGGGSEEVLLDLAMRQCKL